MDRRCVDFGQVRDSSLMNKILQWEKRKDISSPPLKNHTTTLVDENLYIFGGYDGRKNYSSVQVFNTKNLQWVQKSFSGIPPESRNGHTATLVNRHIYIIGGWIESGPSAGNDIHRLDVDQQCWIPTPQSSRAPVCNMHTSDYIPDMNMILVFRGGDGREYLNDLHTYDIGLQDWVDLEVDGSPPTKRANHSSARVKSSLYIFGGWNGRERLNDLYILDTVNLSWSQPICEGFIPQPRAGMSLTAVGDQIYLFGGNGPSSQRYDDLRIICPHDQFIVDEEGKRKAALLWKVCLTPGDESHLPSLYHGSTGVSMQDGETDTMQTPNVSNGCSCCNSDIHLNDDLNTIIEEFNTPLCWNCGQCLKRVYGTGPGKRAGHTATAVGRRIFFIGGGFGSEYVQTIHILDTDAPPEPTIRSEPLVKRINNQLRFLFNSSELSDVIFVFPGVRLGEERRIYGHRILLSLMCDRFRAMFSHGYQESFQLEIPLPHTDYDAFYSLLEYFYTGEPPTLLKPYLDKLSQSKSTSQDPNQCPIPVDDDDIDEDGVPLSYIRILNLLDIADEYLCGPSQGHLKELCEVVLTKMMTPQSTEYLLMRADRSNAFQLRDACLHYLRSLEHDKSRR